MQENHLPQDAFAGKYTSREDIVIRDFCVNTSSSKGKSVLHTNAVSLVIQGEKTVHFASKTVHIRDDQFHFLSAGNCLATLHLSGQKTFRSILLFFTTDTLARFYVKNAERINSIRMQKKIVPEPYISFDKDDFIHNYISSLELLLKGGHDPSPEMKTLKFEELMQYLLEKQPVKLLSFDATDKEKNGDFLLKKTVETNLTNPLTTEEMAYLCNMSLSTFKRHFMRIYGTSPNQWFLQKRMELAALLLQHQSKKPSDIFYQVGYKNHSSFTEAFKQVYGITPREYQSRLNS